MLSSPYEILRLRPVLLLLSEVYHWKSASCCHWDCAFWRLLHVALWPCYCSLHHTSDMLYVMATKQWPRQWCDVLFEPGLFCATEDK